MNLLKPTFILAVLLTLSCESIKDLNNEVGENSTKTKKMMANGFKKGVIVASEKKDDCPYVIEVQDTDVINYLDPVDLPDKFKKRRGRHMV